MGNNVFTQDAKGVVSAMQEIYEKEDLANRLIKAGESNKAVMLELHNLACSFAGWILDMKLKGKGDFVNVTMMYTKGDGLSDSTFIFTCNEEAVSIAYDIVKSVSTVFNNGNSALLMYISIFVDEIHLLGCGSRRVAMRGEKLYNKMLNCIYTAEHPCVDEQGNLIGEVEENEFN